MNGSSVSGERVAEDECEAYLKMRPGNESRPPHRRRLAQAVLGIAAPFGKHDGRPVPPGKPIGGTTCGCDRKMPAGLWPWLLAARQPQVHRERERGHSDGHERDRDDELGVDQSPHLRPLQCLGHVRLRDVVGRVDIQFAPAFFIRDCRR